MTTDLWLSLLGWSAVVNIVLLTFWFLVIVLMPDLIFQIQGRWFNISRERFDTIHYLLLGLFKMGIWLFNLTPWLVLRVIT
ncbi:MAG: hypothetical protein OEU86_00985 [Gammaproteobacteria bacterium]|nr:hypothetical protein [Gammaproteobacteria bacterium]